MSEAVYEFDFLHKVPSNVSDLLAQIVLGEGVICWQPKAHIFVAGWVPAQRMGYLLYLHNMSNVHCSCFLACLTVCPLCWSLQ